MASKLAHVCIESTDLAATERFYQSLGLERRFDFHNKQGALVGFYMKFGDESFLEVVLVREMTPQARFRHFAIETDDIDGAHARLAADGHTPSDKSLGADGTWVVTCHDPSGVFLELHQYSDESMQRLGGVCVVDYQP